MSWKIGDLCVAKLSHLGWTNGEVKQLDEDVALVESFEYGDVEQIDVSELKPFGPFAVNREGEFIESDSSGAMDVCGRWKVGDACVAQWTQDGAWYNSQILHFFNSDEILVRFIDYGNADFTTLGNLKLAGSPLGNVLCQSPKSSLSPSKAEELSPRSMKRVSFVLEEKPQEENNTSCWSVGDRCVAQWNEDGEWYRSKILAMEGEQVSVEFTDYGNEGVTTLDQLRPADALEESEDSRAMWKVGDRCVAMWNENNVWYNSQIIEIDGDRVLVKFIEYGNEDYTAVSQLKPSGSLGQTLVKTKEWKVGDRCVARWEEDKIWYDSEIVKIEGEKVLVRFVEYGNEDYTTLDQLKPAGSLVNEEVTKLVNLKPEGSLVNEEVNKLDHLNPEGSLVIKDGTKLAQVNEEVTKLDQLKPEGSLVIKEDTKLAQVKPEGSLVNEAEGNSTQIDKKMWAAGDLCVAQWEEDQVWYNSKIVEIRGEKALVQFIDYGNEDFANLSQLKPVGSLGSEGLPPTLENQHKTTTLENLSWNVNDFCVAKSVKFNQSYNGQIRKIKADRALVYFIEFSEKEELPFSALLPFGPYAVNKKQKLVEFKDSEDVRLESIDGWKEGDECVAKWVQDNSWYNSKILKIFSETEVLVQFTEFGNADFTNIFELKSLQHSSEVSLIKDEENASENTSDMLKYDEKEISTINKQAADLDIEKGGESVSVELKQNKTEEQDHAKVKETHKLEIKSYHLVQKSMHENMPETEAKTETSESKLKKTESRSAPNRDRKGVGKRWKVGDLCVAKWREDGVWYNSKILGIDNNKVHVLFVDYGNQDYTILEDLKPPGSLDTNGTLKKVDSGQFSDFEETDDKTIKWKVGDVCEAPLNVDESWLSCTILEINFDQVLVEFTEHGSQHYCSAHSLRPLPLGNADGLNVQGKKADIEKINIVNSRNISEKGDCYLDANNDFDTSVNTKEKAEAVELEKIESKKPNKPLATPRIKPGSSNPSHGCSMKIETSRPATPKNKQREMTATIPLAKDAGAANWKVGDKAAAYWQSDGKWRHAIVQELDGDEAFVICPDESMIKGTQVKISELKHKSVPTDGLNLVDDEIKEIKKSKLNLLDTNTLNKSESSDENNEGVDVNPKCNEEMYLNTSTSQSSPGNSANNGVLLTFADLIKQSHKTDSEYSQAGRVKPILSGYKAGTQVGDYKAGTQVGDYKAGTQVGDYKAGTQVGDYKAGTQVGDYKAGTQVGDYKAGTQVADYETETRVADYKAGTPAGDYKAGTQVGDYKAGTQVADCKAGTQVGDYSGKTLSLAMTESGSRYLQSVIPGMTQQEIQNLQTELMVNAVSVMNHPKATFVVQKLMEVVDSSGLEMLVDSVTKHFSWLACHPAGCRVVQKCVVMSSPALQAKVFTQLMDQRSLVMLTKNKYGTRVVQTCLPLMPVKTVMFVVDSLLGHMVDLGRHPHATYFIQQLVALETGHQVGTLRIMEEILQNIDLLAYDKFGTWLVQALVCPTSPSHVLLSLSSWTVANLSSIYVSQPAVFLAVAVFRRLVVLASTPGEDWPAIMANFVTSSTELEVEGRPLLITAALHQVGHLLAREVALQVANILDVPTKTRFFMCWPSTPLCSKQIHLVVLFSRLYMDSSERFKTGVLQTLIKILKAY